MNYGGISFIAVKPESIWIVYNYCMKELNTKIVPVLMILFVLYSNFSNMTSWKHKGSTHSMIFLVFLSKASQHIVLVKTNCFKDVVNASSHIRQQTLRSILIRINWSLCIFFLSLSLPKKPPKVMNINTLLKKNPKMKYSYSILYSTYSSVTNKSKKVYSENNTK